jgi:hypothetical protein
VSRYFFVILSHQMNLSLSAVKLPEWISRLGD